MSEALKIGDIAVVYGRANYNELRFQISSIMDSRIKGIVTYCPKSVETFYDNGRQVTFYIDRCRLAVGDPPPDKLKPKKGEFFEVIVGAHSGMQCEANGKGRQFVEGVIMRKGPSEHKNYAPGKMQSFYQYQVKIIKELKEVKSILAKNGGWGRWGS